MNVYIFAQIIREACPICCRCHEAGGVTALVATREHAHTPWNLRTSISADVSIMKVRRAKEHIGELRRPQVSNGRPFRCFPQRYMMRRERTVSKLYVLTIFQLRLSYFISWLYRPLKLFFDQCYFFQYVSTTVFG